MALLQSFRTHLDGSICNAAQLLLHNGILFNMFSPSLSPQMSDSSASCGKVTYAVHKLTHHLLLHKPNTLDYSWYEEIHDQALSHPYKWVALLEGSIVWQIVIHSLQLPTDSELLVTQGPSEDGFSQRHTIELDSRWLFGNTLQDDKKDLICGVYELETGTLPFLQLINLLTILSRLWWSNGVSVLMATAICFPPLRYVGWRLDSILWSLVPTLPHGGSWTLH